MAVLLSTALSLTVVYFLVLFIFLRRETAAAAVVVGEMTVFSVSRYAATFANLLRPVCSLTLFRTVRVSPERLEHCSGNKSS